jgi:hypothetical protein
MNRLHFYLQKFWLICLVLGVSTGCGIKAPPIVPHSPVPQPIKNLEAYSRAGAVILRWSIPKKNTDDKMLANLAGFHIWRRFIPVEEKDCRTCKPDYELLIELPYAVTPGEEVQEKMAYFDIMVEKEGIYSYYVSSYTAVWIESRGSNVVDLNWFFPLSPPVSIKANASDRIVDLTWKIPSSLAGETGFSGVNVYRRGAAEAYDIIPLNSSPVRENHYQDITVTNGEKYFYSIRSLKTGEEGTVEGKDSSEVSVIPEDRTPPATPLATMAFQSGEGVVIIWEPNIDADLEGYYVYRRGEKEPQATRCSPLIKQETMYLDKTFTSGRTYYYSVTAIDQSPRHNESDFSPELKVATKKP